MWKVARTSPRLAKGTRSATPWGRMAASADAGMESVMALPGRSCASWKKMPVSATVSGLQAELNIVQTLMLGRAE
jgi:hypothetical protein